MTSTLLGALKDRLRLPYRTLMAPIHYRQAICRLAALEKECLARAGDHFDVPFRFLGSGLFDIISPTQVIPEVRQLYEAVRAIRPRCVCEIGTDKGGTFYLWCKAATEDATMISVDLPSRGRYSPQRRRLYAHFGKTNLQRLHFVPGDSHSAATYAKVSALLGGEPLDFLFIDGDHSYAGVRRDYEMYGPLVRPGGLIAFHDIRTERTDVGVPAFWGELKGVLAGWQEFVMPGAGGPLGAGIGVVRKGG